MVAYWSPLFYLHLELSDRKQSTSYLIYNT